MIHWLYLLILVFICWLGFRVDFFPDICFFDAENWSEVFLFDLAVVGKLALITAVGSTTWFEDNWSRPWVWLKLILGGRSPFVERALGFEFVVVLRRFERALEFEDGFLECYGDFLSFFPFLRRSLESCDLYAANCRLWGNCSWLPSYSPFFATFDIILRSIAWLLNFCYCLPDKFSFSDRVRASRLVGFVYCGLNIVCLNVLSMSSLATH